MVSFYALHEHTMRAYVEAMFGEWDETFQRQVHDACSTRRACRSWKRMGNRSASSM